MISIYHAANLTDAYLIRHLLEQERIDAYIAGEYLQGALGELPANTPVEGAFDSNGDGRLNTQRFYDLRGEIVRELALDTR